MSPSDSSHFLMTMQQMTMTHALTANVVDVYSQRPSLVHPRWHRYVVGALRRIFYPSSDKCKRLREDIVTNFCFQILASVS
jgi:hypothetical protein